MARIGSPPAPAPLGGVSLFRGLDVIQLKEVAAVARRVDKGRGENFFRQGQEAHRMFVLTRGRVKLTQITPDGHQLLLRYAGAGNVFGCAPLFGGSEYPATGTAMTPCEALAWDHRTTNRLMLRFPRVAINALVLLGAELSEIRQRYRELATERVQRRVARALLRLVGQAGKRVEQGMLIEFPLSRQDLAELTGTTLHTVSRILSAWENQGLISSGRRRVTIRAPHGLAAIAEDLDSQRRRQP